MFKSQVGDSVEGKDKYIGEKNIIKNVIISQWVLIAV